jgi:hypothetical protein
MRITLNDLATVGRIDAELRRIFPTSSRENGLAIRERVEKLDNSQLAELARWLVALSDLWRGMGLVELKFPE